MRVLILSAKENMNNEENAKKPWICLLQLIKVERHKETQGNKHITSTFMMPDSFE